MTAAGQIRVAAAGRARRRLGAPRPAAGRRRCSPSASSTSRRSCRSIVARAVDGQDRDLPDRPERPRRRDPRRIRGARARLGPASRRAPPRSGGAGGGDGPCGTLTVELFLMRRRVAGRQRARAARPQLGPLDDRGRRDLAVRAAHPGDLRAGARLDGRARARPRWSTCSAPGRDARPGCSAWPRRSADPAVHLHLYDKREVFERRKMGHLTALGTDVDEALATVSAARWRARTGRTRRRRRRSDR